MGTITTKETKIPAQSHISAENPLWRLSPANKPGKRDWLTGRRRTDVGRLYEWGIRDPEAIGEELGLSARTVRKYLEDLGLDPENKGMGRRWSESVYEQYGPGDVSTVAHNLFVLCAGRLTTTKTQRLAKESGLTARAGEAALLELETAGLVYRNGERTTILPG